MAYAGGELALPPLAGTQLPRLSALAANFCLADFYEKRNGFHFYRARDGLSVQPIQIFKIHAEAYANQPVERSAQRCPSLAGIEIIPQFPQPKKEKKDRGSGYQNLVRRQQPHKQITYALSQSQTNLSVQGTWKTL
jgi:hypothetical protein